MTFGDDVLRPTRARSPFMNHWEANKYAADWMTCYLADHQGQWLAPAERFVVLRTDNSACLCTGNGWVKE